jgi:uncharacterized membrane protein YphA (DoxX/SURF4 family)
MDNTSLTVYPWPWDKKIVFRFICLYFLIYVVFCPNNEVAIINTIYQPFNNLLHKLVPWFGRAVLDLSYPITTFTNGSGDTTYDYVLLLIQLILTCIGCIIWSIWDNQRTAYNGMHYWLRVVLRYYLFYQLVLYGIGMIIKTQFPQEGLSRLVQPYGESSPMGLAWTFLGHSYGYNMFMGIAEVLAGVLMLWRRTTTLGSLLAIAVMANVFAVNLFYDVPVKLLSGHMLLMALALLTGDIKRVIDFFILNRAAPAIDYTPVFTRRKPIWARRIVKALFVLFVFIYNFNAVTEIYNQYGEGAPKPALYGLYSIESFIKNRDTLAPLTTDTTCWKRMIVQRAGRAFIYAMNDKRKTYLFEPDIGKKTISVRTEADTLTRYAFTYREPAKNILVLNGVLLKDTLQITMKRIERDSFLLIKTGFRWINEEPFNR